MARQKRAATAVLYVTRIRGKLFDLPPDLLDRLASEMLGASSRPARIDRAQEQIDASARAGGVR